jgi:hypothetical protein
VEAEAYKERRMEEKGGVHEEDGWRGLGLGRVRLGLGPTPDRCMVFFLFVRPIVQPRRQRNHKFIFFSRWKFLSYRCLSTKETRGRFVLCYTSLLY